MLTKTLNPLWNPWPANTCALPNQGLLKESSAAWTTCSVRGQRWPGMNCVASLACSPHNPYLEGLGAFFVFISIYLFLACKD